MEVSGQLHASSPEENPPVPTEWKAGWDLFVSLDAMVRRTTPVAAGYWTSILWSSSPVFLKPEGYAKEVGGGGHVTTTEMSEFLFLSFLHNNKHGGKFIDYR
jgi:hypothetical protein